MRKFLPLLLICWCWTTPSVADPAIWQVTGKHNTLYLLGTIHVLPANEGLARNIDRAYQQAEQLLLEVDTDDIDPLATQMLTLQLGMLPDGQTLQSQLDAATQRKLQAAASEFGVDSELLAHFQPWLAAITLEQLQYAKQGLVAESGMEMQLTQRAAADHKSIHGLETMEQQLKLLAEQDQPAQRAFLRQTLDELSESPTEVQQLLQAWRQGDTRYLQKLLRDSLNQDRQLFTRLVTQRNQHWLTQLKPLLDTQTDDYLVAVGALHLVGDQGLVALLQHAGYQVTLQ
jgi:uncharacterized protein